MNKSINTFATEKVILKDLTVEGGYNTNGGKRINGKINFKTPELSVSNLTVDSASTVYNVLEGYQGSDEQFFLKSAVLDGITADCMKLGHNIFNVYTPAEGAEMVIKNSVFNLNVDKSNVFRISNYTNASNVTIVFDNVEWNYENSTTTDFSWAGLLMYQAVSGKDNAFSGGLDEMKTWTFKFKNCKYNGEKITSNNFGEHSQVFYVYGYNGTSVTVDPEELGFNLVFE